MAKKRRLSKRDRRIKVRVDSTKRLRLLLSEEETKRKLSSTIRMVDETITGELAMIENVIRYYFFDENGIPRAFEVAVLTDEGIHVYSIPYGDDEAPF